MNAPFDQLSAWLKEHRITEVECVISDLTGIARGKIAPTAKFLHERGMRLPESVLLQTVTGDYVDDDIYYSLLDAADMVEQVTGQRPVGYNCNWLRRGPNTLSLLQELGYRYHIDDVSRDEPFIEQVDGRDFTVVPYTLRNNDILLVEGRHYSPDAFLAQIKRDFDQLYAEAGQRRRMMSISAHDRISGTPQMVRAWDEFLGYARSHPGVGFMRKDDIARHVAASPLTLRETETL